eukprot:CAMPEP_0184489714 /NCGR_PEP_ID=MMETSP0113_2-20130426/16191_1 /TAXON_ID=91329 /ORGANISM="Norrisiella sphaerica, Strain BC52" /LENGTH=308 /DNA_ID=CAMNT_0026873297 /DNA_START=246 /DNA_END=1169 /DNA_ORIENTATION=+
MADHSPASDDAGRGRGRDEDEEKEQVEIDDESGRNDSMDRDGDTAEETSNDQDPPKANSNGKDEEKTNDASNNKDDDAKGDETSTHRKEKEEGEHPEEGRRSEDATDPDQGNKIFVGGISRETSEQQLHDAFSKYGEIKDYVIMRDKYTGMSRGFAFVTFKSSDAVKRALESKVDVVGRIVDCKRAVPQTNGPPVGAKATSKVPKKIFVGGLSFDTTDSEFEDYFKKFGKVQEAEIMKDSATGRSRGFGFVTFVEAEVFNKVMEKRDHEIGGREVDCKPAFSKDSMRKPSAFHTSRGFGDRRSSWRGG